MPATPARLRRDRGRCSTSRWSASVDVRGGGPGTRETALLDPAQTVEGIDAIVLSGGSAFGLDAASGVQAWLREQGRGFKVREARVPIVPGADPVRPACPAATRTGAATRPIANSATRRRSSAGSGFRARQRRRRAWAPPPSTSRAASARPRRSRRDGITVGALAAVNAAGSVTVGDGPHFWAAPFEQDNEFGGRGWPAAFTAADLAFRSKGAPRASTTLAVVATDAKLTKAQCKRLAVMAQTGLARAIYPVHTPLDGDIVFAAAHGREAPARSGLRAERARHAGGQCAGARHRPRRL